ncbi:MAG: YCF48-related protein [Calditrichia bacterium]
MLFFISNQAQAQWVTQSPLPTQLEIRGIAAPASQHVFLATNDDPFDNSGALFESLDGGINWVQRDIPANLNDALNGIFFLNSTLGWTFGNHNYRTTDGGTTWDELPFLGSTYFMEFYTPDFGLATGNFGRYISRDGGLNWEPSPADIFAFHFQNNQTGLGASDSGLYRTSDSGANFTLVQAGPALAVTFLSDTVAVGIIDSSFVRSADGGVTWTPAGAADGRSNLIRLSDEVVLAWGRSGSFSNFDDRIFRSDDAGRTWTDVGAISPDRLHSFAVPNAQTVVAGDFSGNMYQSGDAGQTWAQAFASPGPQPGFLNSASPVFTDSLTGYFGYGGGFIIKSTNGGASWTQISSGTAQDIKDMDRFPNGDLIAVGSSGNVLTSDGNGPWIFNGAISTFSLVAVQVINQTDVVAVDEKGRMYSSGDGGISWQAAPAATPNFDAEDLYFTDLQTGWVAGGGAANNAVFHTTDGGATWVPDSLTNGWYMAVDFENSSGWVANRNGSFYRTIDDGATWTQEQLPGSSMEILDMDFYDVSIGYAVGSGGYAVRSDDGGLSWQVLPTPSSSHQLTDIYLIGQNELWVSTAGGVALYTATGGQNWAVLDAGSAGFGSYNTIAASADGDAWMGGARGFIRKFNGPPPPPVNQPPAASFDFSPNGLTVDFTDTSTDPDGSIISWFWEFGDTATSIEQNPTHTFPTAFTYIVRLTVMDDDSATGSAVRFVVVQPNPGGTFGDFTEVTPLDSIFLTPQDEDFWVISTAPADYDADGDLDIAVLGYYVVYNQSVEDRLVLLQNNGQAGPGEWDFQYIHIPFDSFNTGRSDLAWGDADGDGDQDLAVGTNGETVIFRNDAGTLVLTDTQLPGYLEDNDQADFDLRSISWADFDNDADMDLLLPSVFDFSTFSYRTALMRNDGPNGTGGWIFTDMDSVFAPTSHAQSAWADYDGDHDLDLLLVNMSPLNDDSFVRRYRNDGNGVFVAEDILGGLSITHGEAHWGDYEGDGDLDVFVVGRVEEPNGTPNTVLRIYQNDNDIFSPITPVDSIFTEGWFGFTAGTWADYDTDGDMDILLAGTYNPGSQIKGRARIYTNTGSGFVADTNNTLPAPMASGSRAGTFSWLDLDGDGDLDYFIAGQYFVPGGTNLVEAQMHAYRNDSPGQNSPPSTPGGLNSTIQGGGGSGPVIDAGASVLLSWQPASDDHTPVSALTYDLDLYRNGLPVVIPRRLPEPGNISAVNEWLLSGLGQGFYEWTLRAVDAAYAGSPLASGEFTIGNQSISVNQDWNLMSLPLDAADPHYLSVFPDAISNTLFAWDGSYIQADTMEAGRGYWLRFPTGENIPIHGNPINVVNADLIPQWNLIGGPSCETDISAISDPAGIIIPGTIFGFNGSYYAADTLSQGKSYWVRTSAGGQISISCAGEGNGRLARAMKSLPDISQNPAVRISDAAGASQTLYLNVKMEASQKLSYSLPPLPPAGAFDARFSGDFRALESNSGIIEIQSSSYPLTIELINAPAGAAQYFLREKSGQDVQSVHALDGSGTIRISNPAVTGLEIFTEQVVPVEFSIAQNYPNPFNPSTSIRYSIPEQQRVELVIYNALGQQVKKLENGMKPAGYHTAVWDGTNDSGNKVSSGIYIYRFKAGKYESLRKMILLK